MGTAIYFSDLHEPPRPGMSNSKHLVGHRICFEAKKVFCWLQLENFCDILKIKQIYTYFDKFIT